MTRDLSLEVISFTEPTDAESGEGYMKKDRTPTIVSPENTGQTALVYALLFEAPTLLALTQEIVSWTQGHPHHQVLALSHAPETRLEPGANLAGPRSFVVYTGVLLVRPPACAQEQEPPDLPSWDERLLAHR